MSTFPNRNRANKKGDSYKNPRNIATAAIFENVKEQKNRYVEKLWSPEVYQNYSDQDFKSEMRFNPDTFNYILDAIYGQIVLFPTNLEPNHTPPHPQLGLIIYWLATGCN